MTFLTFLISSTLKPAQLNFGFIKTFFTENGHERGIGGNATPSRNNAYIARGANSSLMRLCFIMDFGRFLHNILMTKDLGKMAVNALFNFFFFRIIYQHVPYVEVILKIALLSVKLIAFLRLILGLKCLLNLLVRCPSCSASTCAPLAQS